MANGGISVSDPITWAMRRAKWITFQPFSIGKWFTLGFIAFLASLGQGGANVRLPGRGGRTGPVPGPTTLPGTQGPAAWFGDLGTWVSSNRTAAILIGIGILVLIAAVWLAALWISSRAQFMFLESVAQNTYEIVAPWKRYRALGNSLFAFRAGMLVAGLGAMLAVGIVAVVLARDDIRNQTFGGGATAALILGIVVLVPLLIVFGLVSWCVDTFVSTIMYATGQSVLPAWREFRINVVSGHIGVLILFLLMQIVLGIAVAMLTVAAGCVTCCVGFLPYLSSVITLPLSVFMRSYSVYFLQQFDPRYAILTEATPPSAGFPVIPFPADQHYPPYPPLPAPGTPPPQSWP